MSSRSRRSTTPSLIVVALLCAAGVIATVAASSPKKPTHHANTNSDDYENDAQLNIGHDPQDELNTARSEQQAKPFRAGNEYTFLYNAQVATGLVASDTTEEPGAPPQKAVTRIQAQAKIQFSSERHGTLQLQTIRLGQLNDRIPQPDAVKPMRIFEPKQMPDEKHRKLQLPCQFIYVNGVVERIQFHPQDETWSKNMKRAVLNMLQLNLNKNNAQGLRLPEELNTNTQPLDADQDDDWEREPERPKAFALPEITIEGVCATMYTVQQAVPFAEAVQRDEIDRLQAVEIYNKNK